jgi:hypothetical protein
MSPVDAAICEDAPCEERVHAEDPAGENREMLLVGFLPSDVIADIQAADYGQEVE